MNEKEKEVQDQAETEEEQEEGHIDLGCPGCCGCPTDDVGCNIGMGVAR